LFYYANSFLKQTCQNSIRSRIKIIYYKLYCPGYCSEVIPLELRQMIASNMVKSLCHRNSSVIPLELRQMIACNMASPSAMGAAPDTEKQTVKNSNCRDRECFYDQFCFYFKIFIFLIIFLYFLIILIS
jgi:hypothetical protein